MSAWPGKGPTNGGALTAEEPVTMPASPDAVNVAPRAELKKSPEPKPLFDAEPAAWLSNVSVCRSSEFVFTPGPKTIGDFTKLIVCDDGSVSPTITGVSLVPVMVTVIGWETMPPWPASTVAVYVSVSVW